MISVLVLVSTLTALYTIINTLNAFPTITSAQDMSVDENVPDGICPEIAKLPPQENITDGIPNQPIAK
jgi:hypothetical protein